MCADRFRPFPASPGLSRPLGRPLRSLLAFWDAGPPRDLLGSLLELLLELLELFDLPLAFLDLLDLLELSLARNVFLVVRHSRMKCPHDIGRDSWVWGEQETL